MLIKQNIKYIDFVVISIEYMSKKGLANQFRFIDVLHSVTTFLGIVCVHSNVNKIILMFSFEFL